MNSDQSFYSQLKPFKKFEDFTKSENYTALPDSWVIFLTDVKGSTKAIEQGKYRDVNLIGAATITVCLNIPTKIEFPYVFGGDGATLCVPKVLEPQVEQELAKLQNLSKVNFDLELRVAKIPATDISQHNKEVLVSKFEITKGRSIAFFRGGGLALADDLAKNQYQKYQVTTNTDSTGQLEGLSCRWNPIPPKKDKVISLLVVARKAPAEVYQNVIQQLNIITQQDLQAANPINIQNGTYKSLFKNLSEEWRYHSHWGFKLFQRFCEITMAHLIFKLRIPVFFNRFRPYTNSIPSHSDFRKFDDTLRLVIDCSHQEIESITQYLESEKEAQTLFYGLHISNEALMTCYVQDTQNGNHIHFVDGGDGGYAMAAKQLKAQMSL